MHFSNSYTLFRLLTVMKSKKIQRFDSFYDKIVDYHKQKLLMTKINKEHNGTGKNSTKYNTLSKAKMDITNKSKDTLDAALCFSEIIGFGNLSELSRNEEKYFRKLSKDSNLKEYSFVDEDMEIKDNIMQYGSDFVTTVFDQETVDRILNTVLLKKFEINPQDIRMKSYEDLEEYKINIAKKMLKISINELKSYLPIEWREFLTPKLDEALAICEMIQKDQNELEQEHLAKTIHQSRYER